jgi:glycosyltransferase involved in cell wall biosynthesis
MVVVHIITGLGIGGAESMLLQLLRASARTDTRHIVLTLSSENALVRQVEAANANVVNLRAGGKGWVLAALWRARKLVKTHHASLVMTWLHHADLFGVMLKCLCPKLPLIWNIRCSKLAPGYLPRRNLVMVRILARLSRVPVAIVANSHAGMREHVVVGYRPDGWRILPNGFDTGRLSPDAESGRQLRREIGIEPDAFLIGLVARFHPMKGFDLFVRAAAQVAAKTDKVHFVLVGSGVNWDNQELAEWIAAAGLQKRVTLLGQRHDIPRIMNLIDVLVSSSTSEGFSNVIGEAMACGTPCIATDVGDSASLVGDSGKVIASGDEDALAAAMQDLSEMRPADYNILREAARSRILAEFSINEIAARYQKLFDEFAN